MPEQRPTFAMALSRLEAILDDLNSNPQTIISVTRMSENMMAILKDIPGEKT